MKAFEVRPVYRPLGDPDWIVVVAVDGGDFKPVEAGATYGSRAEADAEAVRLDLQENGP